MRLAKFLHRDLRGIGIAGADSQLCIIDGGEVAPTEVRGGRDSDLRLHKPIQGVRPTDILQRPRLIHNSNRRPAYNHQPGCLHRAQDFQARLWLQEGGRYRLKD